MDIDKLLKKAIGKNKSSPKTNSFNMNPFRMPSFDTSKNHIKPNKLIQQRINTLPVYRLQSPGKVTKVTDIFSKFKELPQIKNEEDNDKYNEKNLNFSDKRGDKYYELRYNPQTNEYASPITKGKSKEQLYFYKGVKLHPNLLSKIEKENVDIYITNKPKEDSKQSTGTYFRPFSKYENGKKIGDLGFNKGAIILKTVKDGDVASTLFHELRHSAQYRLNRNKSLSNKFRPKKPIDEYSQKDYFYLPQEEDAELYALDQVDKTMRLYDFPTFADVQKVRHQSELGRLDSKDFHKQMGEVLPTKEEKEKFIEEETKSNINYLYPQTDKNSNNLTNTGKIVDIKTPLVNITSKNINKEYNKLFKQKKQRINISEDDFDDDILKNEEQPVFDAEERKSFLDDYEQAVRNMTPEEIEEKLNIEREMYENTTPQEKSRQFGPNLAIMNQMTMPEKMRMMLLAMESAERVHAYKKDKFDNLVNQRKNAKQYIKNVIADNQSDDLLIPESDSNSVNGGHLYWDYLKNKNINLDKLSHKSKKQARRFFEQNPEYIDKAKGLLFTHEYPIGEENRLRSTSAAYFTDMEKNPDSIGVFLPTNKEYKEIRELQKQYHGPNFKESYTAFPTSMAHEITHKVQDDEGRGVDIIKSQMADMYMKSYLESHKDQIYKEAYGKKLPSKPSESQYKKLSRAMGNKYYELYSAQSHEKEAYEAGEKVLEPRVFNKIIEQNNITSYLEQIGPKSDSNSVNGKGKRSQKFGIKWADMRKENASKDVEPLIPIQGKYVTRNNLTDWAKYFDYPENVLFQYLQKRGYKFNFDYDEEETKSAKRKSIADLNKELEQGHYEKKKKVLEESFPEYEEEIEEEVKIEKKPVDLNKKKRISMDEFREIIKQKLLKDSESEDNKIMDVAEEKGIIYKGTEEEQRSLKRELKDDANLLTVIPNNTELTTSNIIKYKNKANKIENPTLEETFRPLKVENAYDEQLAKQSYATSEFKQRYYPNYADKTSPTNISLKYGGRYDANFPDYENTGIPNLKVKRTGHRLILKYEPLQLLLEKYKRGEYLTKGEKEKLNKYSKENFDYIDIFTDKKKIPKKYLLLESEQKRLEERKKSPEYIKNVLIKNPYNLKFIPEQYKTKDVFTPDAIQKSILRGFYNLNYIPEEYRTGDIITPEVATASLIKKPWTFSHISSNNKNKIITPEVIKSVIKRQPTFIRHISEPYLVGDFADNVFTPEIVKHIALKYINGLELIPDKYKTKEVFTSDIIKQIANQNINYLQFIPEQYKNNDEIFAPEAVKEILMHDISQSQFIPDKYKTKEVFTPEIIKNAIIKNHFYQRYIPSNYLPDEAFNTETIRELAIKNPYGLPDIPDKYKTKEVFTPEVIKKIISIDPSNLKYVPEQYKSKEIFTPELIKEVALDNPNNLQFIPERVMTSDIYNYIRNTNRENAYKNSLNKEYQPKVSTLPSNYVLANLVLYMNKIGKDKIFYEDLKNTSLKDKPEIKKLLNYTNNKGIMINDIFAFDELNNKDRYNTEMYSKKWFNSKENQFTFLLNKDIKTDNKEKLLVYNRAVHPRALNYNELSLGWIRAYPIDKDTIKIIEIQSDMDFYNNDEKKNLIDYEKKNLEEFIKEIKNNTNYKKIVLDSYMNKPGKLFSPGTYHDMPLRLGFRKNQQGLMELDLSKDRRIFNYVVNR